MSILGAAVILAGVVTGCGSLRAATSGQIGCAEDDIVITDDSPGWSSRTWTAQCHGKRYFCSAVSTGKDTSQVTCKRDNEEEAGATASPATPPAAAGCQYDAQCKGDRVCVSGKCVAPQ